MAQNLGFSLRYGNGYTNLARNFLRFGVRGAAEKLAFVNFCVLRVTGNTEKHKKVAGRGERPPLPAPPAGRFIGKYL